jgi:hypothetical protein
MLYIKIEKKEKVWICKWIDTKNGLRFATHRFTLLDGIITLIKKIPMVIQNNRA